MKKAILILCVLGVAAAIGYLLGTENGRAQRDQALTKLKSARGTIDENVDSAVTDISDAAADTAEVAAV